MAEKPQQPKAKKRTGGKTVVNWLELRMEYITDSSIAYSDLAKKYGISKSSVQKRGTDEDWSGLRRAYAAKAFEDFQKNMLDQKSQAQSDHLISYKNMRALANRAIMEMSQFNPARDRRGNLLSRTLEDGSIEPISQPLNPFELEKLAKALHQAIVGERIVLGMPSSVSGISDAEGGDVFKGLSDLIATARKTDEPDTKKTS